VTFDSISQVITGIKSTQKAWQKHYQFQKILEHWSEIVGEMVAQQTRPTGIYDRILKVAVSTPQWSQALAFERLKLLAKLQGSLPNAAAIADIVDIHFSTAQWYSAPKLPPGMDKPMILARQTREKQAGSDRQSGQSSPEPESQQLQMPPQDAQEAFERWAKAVINNVSSTDRCGLDLPLLAIA
jgi:predicted nucleic acid-binding Zn ribbon protein